MQLSPTPPPLWSTTSQGVRQVDIVRSYLDVAQEATEAARSQRAGFDGLEAARTTLDGMAAHARLMDLPTEQPLVGRILEHHGRAKEQLRLAPGGSWDDPDRAAVIERTLELLAGIEALLPPAAPEA